MEFEFIGRIWYWHGPAPWFFVTVPEKESQDLQAVLRLVTYGWGMVPARVRIGRTEWETALWPKDGRYIVPLKAAVRRAENLELDQEITVRLHIQ